ncbi:MAG: AAA family ATPase [Saprospiraceae bacterium]|nr:ATP-binding protein [Saprospiraceae bacterium]MDW8229310.1 AAA family ATPase [Saprospiraceae bacterium]
MLKKLPAGESNFPAIREGNWLYVDKTEEIYRLVNAGKYFFLSRPRRFGKSLTVSTLKALFEGRRELFEGLWIHDHSDWDWNQKHPVISLSFNGLDYINQPLEVALAKEVERKAALYGLHLRETTSKERFKELIIALGQTERVVVLIDEYDKPINDFLDNYEKADTHRDLLGNFFGVLKADDVAACLRFVFITGVSKFSKVTLFSELNNLTDLSQHDEFGTLVGITQSELEEHFGQHIERLAQKTGLPHEAVLDKIRYWYNGYTWDGRNFVYNPFSLLGLFGSGTFKNFWFTSGTTGWLARKMRDTGVNVAELEGMVVRENFFDKFEIRHLDPTVLLYQTGYLTIKEIIREDVEQTYRLGFPNYEVRTSLMDSLLQAYADMPVSAVGTLMQQIRAALVEHNLPEFIALLRSIFANISHRLLKQYVESDDLKLWEAYYQTVIYLALHLTGGPVACEVQTNRGYIDAVAETPRHIYVMEFKVGAAAEAMQQIKERGYHEAYLHRGKPVTLLAVGFDAQTRNIGDWAEEAVA